MKVSLLTIGDELLIGQVLNSNVQWMSEQLTLCGCEVIAHLSVGDKHDEITHAISFLKQKSEAIIIGGGLGPTHDDLTLEVLSQTFQIPLYYDEDWINQVREWFKARNRPMAENNKKQAYLLTGAKRIDNDCGTAAGQDFTVSGLRIFVVPGVPHEMKSMMNRHILPELKKQTKTFILKETLLTTGIGESLLAERCHPFVEKVRALNHVTLAFLPSNIGVRLRLQMRSEALDQTSQASAKNEFHDLVQELRAYCKDDFYGFQDETLESLIHRKLRENNQTLALAESCTGGLISHRLTQVPGASSVLKGAVISYADEIKIKELGISASFLKENGVVSEATAVKMAEAIRTKWGTDYGVASTGFLGPSGGDTHAPLGTVWVAVATKTRCLARTFSMENNRERAKERTAQAALDLLRRNLAI